jgi:hypothetical protein
MLARAAGDPRGGAMHVDGAYNWFRRDYPEVRTLIVIPELGYQRPSRSDIYRLAVHDQIPAIATAAQAFRKLKSTIIQFVK